MGRLPSEMVVVAGVANKFKPGSRCDFKFCDGPTSEHIEFTAKVSLPEGDDLLRPSGRIVLSDVEMK